MGGKVASLLALNYPDLISNLILVDIAPILYSPVNSNPIEDHRHFAQILKDINLEGKSKHQVGAELESLIPDLATRLFLLTNLSFDKKHNRLFWRVNLDSILRSYDELRDFPVAADTPPFTKPTLVIKGSLSPYISSPLAYNAIDSLFPNHTFCSVSNAGHWPHFGTTAHQFVDIVVDWLSDKLLHK